MLLDREPSTGKDYWELVSKIIADEKARRFAMPNGEQDWLSYYKTVDGDHWINQSVLGPTASDYPRDRITVNITGSDVLSFQSFLVKQEPVFSPQPRSEDKIENAENAGTLLNYEWRRRSVQRQIERGAEDCVTIGWNVWETGVALEENVDRPRNPNLDGQVAWEDYVADESVWVRRVHPLRFYFQSNSPERDLHTSRYCWEEVWKPLGDVLATARYDKQAIRQIKSGMFRPDLNATWQAMAQSGTTVTANVYRENQPCDYGSEVCLFKWFDRKWNKKAIIIMGSGPDGRVLPLYEDDDNEEMKYLKGVPYVKVDFIHRPNQPYGTGVPRLIKDSQDQLNRIRTLQFDTIRRNTPKYAAGPGVSDQELIKFETGPSNSTVRMENPEGDIRPIAYVQISPDVWQVEGVIRDDIKNADGLSDLQRSGQLPNRAPARGVQAMVDYQNLKTDARSAGFDAGVKELGWQLLRHMQANYNTPHAVQIIGPQGNQWKTLTAREIEGEFDMEMESTSAPRHDPEYMQAQAQQMLAGPFNPQTLPVWNQMLQAENPPKVIIASELLKWYFKQFSIVGAGRFFPPMLVIANPEITALEGQPTNPPQPTAPPPRPAQPQQPQLPGQSAPSDQQIQRESSNPRSAAMGGLLGLLNSPGGMQQ